MFVSSLHLTVRSLFFFFNDTATTEIYTLSLHDALPISLSATDADAGDTHTYALVAGAGATDNASFQIDGSTLETNAVFDLDRKSTRLNSSHANISYAVFCLKKKKKKPKVQMHPPRTART